MKQIASFSINHDILVPGLYVSRVDGDCVTYDIRMKCPNEGDYVSQGALHTLEHLIATYLRSSDIQNSVIYFGPMGCRTGCYLVMRDDVSKEEVIRHLCDAFRFTADFEGEIPGAKRRECGNYLEHDLPDAKREAAEFVKVLSAWNPQDMTYPE
ncbi:MAG: S-ribosylhomocysteine lyase [Clostridia bacterium]|nr:S-ribosylhomocysteine lyase [Clostridia bacterium]